MLLTLQLLTFERSFYTWFLLTGACSTLAVHCRFDKWSVLCLRDSCTRRRQYHRRGHVHRQYTSLFHVHEEQIAQRIWHTSVSKRVQFWSEWREPHWLSITTSTGIWKYINYLCAKAIAFVYIVDVQLDRFESFVMLTWLSWLQWKFNDLTWLEGRMTRTRHDEILFRFMYMTMYDCWSVVCSTHQNNRSDGYLRFSLPLHAWKLE